MKVTIEIDARTRDELERICRQYGYADLNEAIVAVMLSYDVADQERMEMVKFLAGADLWLKRTQNRSLPDVAKEEGNRDEWLWRTQAQIIRSAMLGHVAEHFESENLPLQANGARQVARECLAMVADRGQSVH